MHFVLRNIIYKHIPCYIKHNLTISIQTSSSVNFNFKTITIHC